MMLRTLVTSLLVSLSLAVHAASEVIPLSYRTADDILALAQSVVGSEGSVSAYGNQLIVNASPSKIDELRALIQQLDTRPRRLLISVDSSDSSQQSDRGYAVNGSASIGGVDIEAGQGEVNNRDQVRILRRTTANRSGGVQQVQTSEGYPALIQVGQSVPLNNTSIGPYGQVYNQTQYRNVTQGFYVTASLTGDIVHVSISSNNDKLSQNHSGAIDIQSTDTRVSGRVGEWLTLGGVSSDNQTDQSGFLQRRSTQGQQDMTLRLKVEVLP
jgi:type II secretory pathway component GspD/PulD (secretin)